MLQIASFTFNPFQENTYVVSNSITHECAIIDPGCFEPREQRELKQFIDSNGLTPVQLINTHCHIDHILGNDWVMSNYQLPLHLHRDELFTYRDANKWTAMFGMPPLVIPDTIIPVEPGDEFSIVGVSCKVLYTPGHSVASLSFYFPENGWLIAGDVLFRESIGRTDLPGGNFDTLISSIRTKLFTLPDDTMVYSGHGPQTTIGHEKMFNPFLT
jgi:glyoxylase-like metal-dependent hydrolase (beta-lactamase superfamily II)